MITVMEFTPTVSVCGFARFNACLPYYLKNINLYPVAKPYTFVRKDCGFRRVPATPLSRQTYAKVTGRSKQYILIIY